MNCSSWTRFVHSVFGKFIRVCIYLACYTQYMCIHSTSVAVDFATSPNCAVITQA